MVRLSDWLTVSTSSVPDPLRLGDLRDTDTSMVARTRLRAAFSDIQERPRGDEEVAAAGEVYVLRTALQRWRAFQVHRDKMLSDAKLHRVKLANYVSSAQTQAGFTQWATVAIFNPRRAKILREQTLTTRRERSERLVRVCELFARWQARAQEDARLRRRVLVRARGADGGRYVSPYRSRNARAIAEHNDALASARRRGATSAATRQKRRCQRRATTRESRSSRQKLHGKTPPPQSIGRRRACNLRSSCR